MAIVIEDGTGKSDAQAYVDASYLDAWMAERGYMTDKTEQQKEAAIVIAAKDWIDGQHSFSGRKLNADQAMEFPRETGGVPGAVKQANAQAAYLQLNNALLVDTTAISTAGFVESESKSVGPLSKSVTYKSGSAQIYGRILPVTLTNLLKPYLRAGYGGLGLAYRV